MDSRVVQVWYNSRAKSYNFVPVTSISCPQLQPWVEVELEDGQILRTKLLVSNIACLTSVLLKDTFNSCSELPSSPQINKGSKFHGTVSRGKGKTKFVFRYDR